MVSVRREGLGNQQLPTNSAHKFVTDPAPIATLKTWTFSKDSIHFYSRGNISIFITYLCSMRW